MPRLAALAALLILAACSPPPATTTVTGEAFTTSPGSPAVPLADCAIGFYRTVTLQTYLDRYPPRQALYHVGPPGHTTRTGQDGKFSTTLPPGDWIATCQSGPPHNLVWVTPADRAHLLFAPSTAAE